MLSLIDGASMSCGMSTSLTPGSPRLLADFLRHGVGILQIGAADLHVDRRGQAEIQHGIDQAARLEVGADFRHLFAHGGADAVHVLVAPDLVIVR